MLDAEMHGETVTITNGHIGIELTFDEAESLANKLMFLLHDWDERRIDIIGQNGNGGEHY